MRIKINKKIAGLLATTAIVTTIAGGIAKKINYTDKSFGHNNISPIINLNVDENDFVVLDVGDHNTIKTRFQDNKMSYCNSKDISLGIIINSDSKKLSDIYKDVEYTKGVLSKHQVNFPVFLNINTFMENKKLDNNQKKELIDAFLQKCSNNKIYVGLYGTDTNLCTLSSFYNFEKYDSFLVMDKETISYDKTHNITQDLSGKITTSDINYNEVIKKNNLNTENRFVYDEVEEIKSLKDLDALAEKYNISKKVIKEYNNLFFCFGKTKIRIPNSVIRGTSNEKELFKKVDKPLKGCDMSQNQTKVDYNKLKENFDYCILRATSGVTEDTSFEKFYKNLTNKGMAIGVYCYNPYTTENTKNKDDYTKKVEAQTNYLLEKIKDKNIKYPVCIDIEGKGLEKKLPKEYVEILLQTFEKKVSEKGYTPGIYCNKSAYKHIQSSVNYNLEDKFQLWIAGGNQYTNETKDIEFKKIVPTYHNDIPATIVQATDSAINAGAANHKGHLDINFSTVDYTTKSKLDRKTFDALETRTYMRIDPLAVAGLGVGAAVLAPKVKKLIKKDSSNKKTR